MGDLQVRMSGVHEKEKTQTDNTNLNTGYLPIFGSNWSNTTNAGVFYLNVNYTTSNTSTNIGRRQM